MNIRNTVFLFCLSLGILWLFGLMLEYKKTSADEGLIMPSLKNVRLDDVRSLSIQFTDKGKNQEIEFFQGGDGWTVGENVKVQLLLIKKIFDEIKAAGKIDEQTIPPDNGTDNPGIVVTIKGINGKKEWQFKIGRVTKDKTIAYVTGTDRPGQVFAVARNAIETVFRTDVNEFRSLQPFDFNDNNVKLVKLTRPADQAKKENKNAELELKREDQGDRWMFVQPAGLGYAEASTEPPPPNQFPEKPEPPKEEAKTGVRLLIAKIHELKVKNPLEDFEPINNAVDLAKFGLKEGEEKTLRIQVTSGEPPLEKKEVLLIGDKAAKKDPKDNDQYFACLAGDKGVFRLSAEQINPILKALDNPRELRSKEVLFVDKKKVDMIRLSKGKDFLLTRPEGWLLRTDDGKTLKANKDAVEALLKNLDARILKFADDADDAKLGLTKESFSVTLYEDAKPKAEEKKPAGEAKKEDKKDEKLALTAEPDVLEGKDKSTVVSFKNGKPKTVTPTDDKLVKAEIAGDTVKFTQLADPDKEDKTVEFKVRGSKDGKDDKEEVNIKIIVRKKPAVTLTFGKVDAEGLPVKRVMADGTVQRFYLNKDLGDKIIPADVVLAYLDLLLPEFQPRDVARLTYERGKEKLEINRITADLWLFNNPSALPSENLADTAKIHARLRQLLLQLRPSKWVARIDDKTDLAKFGLKDKTKGIDKDKDKDYPTVTVAFIIKNTTPKTAAGIVGLLGSRTGLEQADLAGASFLAGWMVDPGQSVVLQCGKDTEDKDNPGTYCRFIVEQNKDAKKEDGKDTNDLIFLLSTNLAKVLIKDDLHDRGAVLLAQPCLDAGAVGAGMGPWGLEPLGVVPWAPLVNPAVLSFDPAKVERIHLETRGVELRKFDFKRDKPAEKPKVSDKEKEKEKEKTKEKPAAEPPSLKGQTWQDQSGLIEFALDSEKVNELVLQLAKLDALRLTTLNDGPRAFQKLGPKDAVVQAAIFLEGNAAPITLTVGAKVDLPQLKDGYYATVSTRPQAVFIIPSPVVDAVLGGTVHFGKAPDAIGQ